MEYKNVLWRALTLFTWITVGATPYLHSFYSAPQHGGRRTANALHQPAPR